MYNLELRNIYKTYPGSKKKANNNISLQIKKGEIFCIAGENGAGKTTLMKILCGLEKQDAGGILINGEEVIINSVYDAKNHKIGMVHQHFMLFPEYTVSENIVMGSEPEKWGVFFDSKKAQITADKIISENNFSVKSKLKVKDLTLGEMQQVEICRILHQDSQIIILDEPTSILTEQEVKSLFETLKKLASSGKTIILITHKLHEIKQVSDRAAVLRRGELAGILNVSEIDEKKIAQLMIGNYNDDLEKKINLKSVNERYPVIEFESVTVRRHGQKRPLLDNVSFSAYSGEILCFAGVGGNGLGVIEAVLGGFLHPESGKILLRGKDISKLNTRALRKEGLVYVPADRTRVGSAPEATIAENMLIIKRNEKLSLKFYDELIKKYKIDAVNIKEKASTLSGGNLQKLILAREINCLRDYIVLSEPTWGLDIASSRFILNEIDSLRKTGAAVLLISTNLDEIIELADRIIVMYSGRTAGVIINEGESIKEKIGNCMQGLVIN